MKNKNKCYRVIFTTSVVVALLIFVVQIGDNVVASTNNVLKQLRRFEEVFRYVKRFYVEDADTEKIVTGAINGMLSELDPHSVYIPASKVEDVNERFQGSYEGIGIEFLIHKKMLIVQAPIVGGPSEAVGLQPGDQIIKIEGKSAYGITENEVREKLRGRKGTKVNVTIRRPGQRETFDVMITRDKIPIYSVTAEFMLTDEVGYIHLSRFAQKTPEELWTTVRNLKAQGMRKLILDLRLNNGGYLDQAVEVADMFIPAGQKIVYTKGRIAGSNEVFYSKSNGRDVTFPLIVLIDHGSASASEIVAGAVQDLDRGLVVGETSFGKGLVQRQLPLADGGALRLTIARYYTPSGRLIQRAYDEGFMEYYMEAYEDRDTDSDTTVEKKLYSTLGGRKVFGGGGITPDVKIKSDKITVFTSNLISKRIFFEFGSRYASKHKNWAKNFNWFRDHFQISDAMMTQLRQLTAEHKIDINEEELNKDIEYIKVFAKAEIARHLWGSQKFYQIRAMGDKQLQEAVKLFPQAVELAQFHHWK